MPKNKAHRRVPTTEETDDGSVSDKDSKKYLDSLKAMSNFSSIVDRKGRTQFAADDAVKALGYTEDDILRKPFWEASWFSDSPESQRVVKQGVLDALAGQRVECRVQALTKEGTSIPVTFNISPLKGPEGAVVGIVAETEPLDLHEE
jgi:PAS domain S-box-containing protein